MKLTLTEEIIQLERRLTLEAFRRLTAEAKLKCWYCLATLPCNCACETNDDIKNRRKSEMDHIFDEAELLRRAEIIGKITSPEWGRTRRSGEGGQFARDMVTLTYLFETESEAIKFIKTIEEVA